MMTSVDEGDEAASEFRAALRRAIEASGMKQVGLAKAIGVDRALISQWVTQGEPPWRRVLEMERGLRLRGGTLSQILGYLPVDAKPVKSVLDAIDADPKLTELTREVLRAAYRAAVEP